MFPKGAIDFKVIANFVITKIGKKDCLIIDFIVRLVVGYIE